MTKYDSHGQITSGLVVNLVVILAIFAFGVLIFSQIQGTVESQAAGSGTNATVVLLDQDMNFGAVYWDNATTGDNNFAVWDNWGAAEDNAFWDNMGPANAVGVRVPSTTIWSQSIVVPDHNAFSAATFSADYLVADATEMENISLYVILENPNGVYTTLVSLENTAALHTTDNVNFTALENNVLPYITVPGTYTLRLHDNIDRVAIDDLARDNYTGVVWTNASFSVTTYMDGLGENLVASVGETGEEVFPLIELVITLAVFGAIIFILKTWG